MKTIEINGTEFSENEILQLLQLVNELVGNNEELNAKIIAMDAYVKNGDSKLKVANRYISQLETLNSQLNLINQQLQTPNLN